MLPGSAGAQPADAPREAPRPVVRIATEGAFPPFNYVENGEPTGFEVELGRALCEAGRLACTFVVHDWEGILRSLDEGRHDAVMASLQINERRRKRVAFTKPYLRLPSALIGPKDALLKGTDEAALAGRRIGVLDRSEHLSFLEERRPQAEARVYGKLEEANLDLLTGRIDLVLGDKLALSRFLDSREGAGCCRFLADLPRDEAIFGEGVAIALRKGDHALKARFDEAIDRVMAEGTYDRISAKYFPFPVR